MQDAWTRLEVISKMLSDLDNLYLWQFDSGMNLLKSNHPDKELLISMIEINDGQKRVLECFSAEEKPVVLTDSMAFAWAVDRMQGEDGNTQFLLLGPALTSSLPERNLIRKMEEIHLPLSLRRELLSCVGSVPVIHPTAFARYAVILHYCITGTRISSMDVNMGMPVEQIPQELTGELTGPVFHGTWSYEQQMLKAVQEGDMTFLQRRVDLPAGSSTGTLCPGDPLRQTKDESIALVVLCSRAAIIGGLSQELSYTLSDYYVQNIEAAGSIREVYAINMQILPDYINRVHQIRQNANYSQLTRACVDYVAQHITEKIQVSDIAAAIGYADYYLTSRFKKDTGIGLRDYINQQKVEQAKLWLRSTKLSIQQVADELNFSSASYFCSVFRKVAGISPGDFRDPLNNQ